jgi:hypothetical protein
MLPRWTWKHWLGTVAAVSLLCLVVPGASDWFRGLTLPLLGLFQGPARSGAVRLADKADAALSGSVPRAELAKSADENAALRAENAALRSRLAEAEELVAQLTGLREQFPAARFAAVAMPTVSRDAVPARESVLLRKPSAAPWDRIGRGQWALARLFTSAPEGVAAAGVEDAPVFWDKTLVGRVDSVAGGYCRVKLVSDLDFQSAAEILDDDGRVLADGLLVGRGEGRMEVRFVERGKADVAAGHWVRLPAGKSGLPTGVIIGRVSKCVADPGGSPLLQIEAVPVVDLKRLETVLILVGREPGR